MACWNVCPAGCEDFGAVARMGSDDLDDWLGVFWLYLRTLRNVEKPPCADSKLNSAKPKTAAVEGCTDIPCPSLDGLSDTANTSTVRRRPFQRRQLSGSTAMAIVRGGSFPVQRRFAPAPIG